MSAWLNSWGLSWGNSWGSLSEQERPPAGYGGYKDTQTTEDEEIVLLAKVVIDIINDNIGDV
jgi:hypothetical protein